MWGVKSYSVFYCLFFCFRRLCRRFSLYLTSALGFGNLGLNENRRQFSHICLRWDIDLLISILQAAQRPQIEKEREWGMGKWKGKEERGHGQRKVAGVDLEPIVIFTLDYGIWVSWLEVWILWHAKRVICLDRYTVNRSLAKKNMYDHKFELWELRRQDVVIWSLQWRSSLSSQLYTSPSSCDEKYIPEVRWPGWVSTCWSPTCHRMDSRASFPRANSSANTASIFRSAERAAVC